MPVLAEPLRKPRFTPFDLHRYPRCPDPYGVSAAMTSGAPSGQAGAPPQGSNGVRSTSRSITTGPGVARSGDDRRQSAPGGPRRPRPAPWPGCTAGRLPAGSRDRPCRPRRRSRCGQLRSRRPGTEGRGSGTRGRPGEVPCAGPGPSPYAAGDSTATAARPNSRQPQPGREPVGLRRPPPRCVLMRVARPMTAGHNGEHLERLRDSRPGQRFLTPPGPTCHRGGSHHPKPKGVHHA